MDKPNWKKLILETYEGVMATFSTPYKAQEWEKNTMESIAEEVEEEHNAYLQHKAYDKLESKLNKRDEQLKAKDEVIADLQSHREVANEEFRLRDEHLTHKADVGELEKIINKVDSHNQLATVISKWIKENNDANTK